MNNEIGCRLKRLREEMGHTQKDIANVLGVTPAAYGKIEAGDRGLSSEYCIQLADYFGVTCDYLLRGVSSENVDVCGRTGLDQQTIEILEKSEQRTKLLARDMNNNENQSEDDKERMADILAGLFLHDTRSMIMNMLLQDQTFLTELAKECFDVAVYTKEYLVELSGANSAGASEASLWEIEHTFRTKVNGSRFASSRLFDQFYTRVCSGRNIIEGLTGIPENLIELGIKEGILHE